MFFVSNYKMISVFQKKDEWLDLLVNGYIKNTFRKYAPNIIVYNIKLFYCFNNIYPFNIYHYSDNKWNKINVNNITEVYCVRKGIFFVTNNQHQNHNKRKRQIELISETRCGRHAIFYINNKLYGAGNNDSKQLSSKKYKNGATICKNVCKVFGGIIRQIEAGSQHSLFLTDNGTVYGLGSNKYGQLLLRNRNKNYDHITLIPKLNGIISIRCCGETSYVLNRNGKMYSFGSSNNGALCVSLTKIGDPNDPARKYHIKSMDKIVSINSGESYACFITQKKNIYLFGKNDWKQCGSKRQSDFVEMPLQLKRGYHFIGIECGGYHNIIKTNDNRYYGFGRNDKKQCLFGFYGNNTVISYDNPQHISLKKLKKCIGNNNDIIGFKPTYLKTFVFQKI